MKSSRNSGNLALFRIIYLGELGTLGINNSGDLVGDFAKLIGKLCSGLSELCIDSDLAILTDDEGNKLLAMFIAKHFEEIGTAGTHKICSNKIISPSLH